MARGKRPTENPLPNLFPESGRVLLTGTGKQFVERIGVTATREAIYRVMLGENLRTQTEPLSRRRIAQVSGALVALFAQGRLADKDFLKKVNGFAVEQFRTARKNDNALVWPAQWLLGLTGKSVQNVLRSNQEALDRYVADFDEAIRNAARHCRDQLGDYRMTLGYYKGTNGKQVELDWEGITRLTTAIGAQTLTIRGSDKSIYGKLFERLILGAFLTVMGFQQVNPQRNKKDRGVFWLSDNSNERESDATLLIEPGKLARFDIGFIGPGNSEISKDKLSRFARELERAGTSDSSVTFIVVDRLPKSGKTEQAAKKIGAEIVQMSMRYWPRDLAGRLKDRLGVSHALGDMPDSKLQDYLKKQLDLIAVQDFLSEVTVKELEETPADDETEANG